MSVRAVVDRHLDAVRSGDPAAMAADYADDAVLERPDGTHRGRAAIAAYFRDVPQRLGQGRVVFDRTEVDGDVAVFWWRIVGGPADGVAGHDTCTVRGDRIVTQHVVLDRDDF